MFVTFFVDAHRILMREHRPSDIAQQIQRYSHWRLTMQGGLQWKRRNVSI